MLKTTMALALLSLTSAGCFGYTIPMAGEGYDGPTNPQPGQTIAAHIVWNEVFGLADGSEHPILWHFDDNCSDSSGNYGPKWGTRSAFKSAHSDVCEDGQFETSGWVETTEFDATNRIDIEWHGTFSDSQTFAHELCHAFNLYTGGDGDEGHTSDCFVGTDRKPYPGLGDTSEGSLVYKANQALIAAGF